jgi:hypothetical protein
MNDELTPTRAGCCFVSSFILHHLLFRGHRPAQFHRATRGDGQRSTIKQSGISRQHEDAIKPTIIRQIIVRICHGIAGRCERTAQVAPICHVQI